jgi:hypothetical protein
MRYYLHLLLCRKHESVLNQITASLASAPEARCTSKGWQTISPPVRGHSQAGTRALTQLACWIHKDLLSTYLSGGELVGSSLTNLNPFLSLLF